MGLLVLLNLAIWYVAVWENRGNILKVAFLNIGQGDAILIEAPNGNKMMIDGGPGGAAVESELSKQLPFYDRHLDLIILTHPDADHVAGFQSILNDYQVNEVMEPGSNTDTETYKKIEDTITAKNLPKVLARRGMRIILDRRRKIYLTILFPDRDPETWDTNTSSIVARLTYGHNSFLFQGDSPQMIENYLVSLDGANLKSDVLKAGHHGSKTSTSDLYVQTVQPVYTVISAGLHNRYGFPHHDTIDILNKYHTQLLKTYELGTIVLKSNGTNLTYDSSH
ncbi:MAG TPA: MBL fold metallo-hydrolase [Candidatus Paceibacterota bacterium]|nr:MBL fold metallo-hydrolase [Candidatus Paceibacterota bacterium]